MADVFVPKEGNLNGTTAVTVVSAPASVTVRITAAGSVSVCNVDTVDHVITFQKDKGGTKTVLYSVNALANGGVAVLPMKVGLDATDESIEAKSDAAATTTEPRYNSVALDTT